MYFLSSRWIPGCQPADNYTDPGKFWVTGSPVTPQSRCLTCHVLVGWSTSRQFFNFHSLPSPPVFCIVAHATSSIFFLRWPQQCSLLHCTRCISHTHMSIWSLHCLWQCRWSAYQLNHMWLFIVFPTLYLVLTLDCKDWHGWYMIGEFHEHLLVASDWYLTYGSW